MQNNLEDFNLLINHPFTPDGKTDENNYIGFSRNCPIRSIVENSDFKNIRDFIGCDWYFISGIISQMAAQITEFHILIGRNRDEFNSMLGERFYIGEGDCIDVDIIVEKLKLSFQSNE